jgi:hypothetical protein
MITIEAHNQRTFFLISNGDIIKSVRRPNIHTAKELHLQQMA